MSYQKAEKVLPVELLELIQEYIEGEMIYIPKKKEHKKHWGANTEIHIEMEKRNCQIYNNYCNGFTIDELSNQFYLSIKSIQRIILNEKRRIT